MTGFSLVCYVFSDFVQANVNSVPESVYIPGYWDLKVNAPNFLPLYMAIYNWFQNMAVDFWTVATVTFGIAWLACHLALRERRRSVIKDGGGDAVTR
jgi:hypothetical protein